MWDAILAYLAEPHSSIEVAAQLHQPHMMIRGALFRLCRRGFVQRVMRNLYVKVGYRGPASESERQRLLALLPLPAKLRILLRQRKTLAELCALTGIKEATVGGRLSELRAAGEISGNDETGYYAREPHGPR